VPDTLTLRALNRATLGRQLLLRRDPMPAAAAIARLGGMQAQAPLAPYTGLWSRLGNFKPEVLSILISERAVVRAHLQRNTVQLLTAQDYLDFRPLCTVLAERGARADFASRLAGADPAEAVAFRGEGGAELLDLPDAARPDPGTPAPPRFLPVYDNLLLSHADRSRVIPHGRPVPLPAGNGSAQGTVQFDGRWQGTWRIAGGVMPGCSARTERQEFA